MIRHIHLLPSFQFELIVVDKVVDVHRRMHVGYQRHTKENYLLHFQHFQKYSESWILFP